MPDWSSKSTAEQLAEYLRGQLLRHRWSGVMPGVHLLAAELGVHRKTADSALRVLEGEGMLVPQGAGRRRRIVLPSGQTRRSLRVAILVSEWNDRRSDYMVALEHGLQEAGHAPFFAEPHLVDLGMNVRRIARMVARTEADAWVVAAGSRGVLEWFAAQSVPAFALFGRRRDLPMAGAGPDQVTAYVEAARALIALGHRRIVLLARRRRRLPEPGAPERAFLAEMAAHGLPVGNYNLPDWEETPAGFQARLASLLQVTPPTAMIIDEVPFVLATLQFLGRRRLLVPEDVSLVSTEATPSFDWCQPSISHMRWAVGPVVQRVVDWAANVSQGKMDLLQTLAPAEFVPGGSIGPAGPR